MATTDKGRTFAALACHLLQSGVAASPEQAAVMACDLVPISRKLHKIAEDDCNGIGTAHVRTRIGHGDVIAEEHTAEQRRKQQIRKARDVLERGNAAGCDFRAKTDPRAGFGLLLKFTDGRTNDFGQEGIIVPTSVTD